MNIRQSHVMFCLMGLFLLMCQPNQAKLFTWAKEKGKKGVRLLGRVLGRKTGKGKEKKIGTTKVSGYYMLRSPLLNKGRSFTEEERGVHNLRGLIPCGDVVSLEEKVEMSMEQFYKKTSPLEKYIYLHTTQDSDETLYYAILVAHTAEVMPYVYTPTVGQACQEWSTITRHTPRGLYLSINDKGHIRKILDNWPQSDINTIVVTDGERILGLGDLGANGMGIPVGKLALYTACAGIDPAKCLPVHIDVGTNREELRNDKRYMGLRRERERGPAYDELIAEFFDACADKYGRQVLIQFEDFGNSNAFRLLEQHQNKSCCFNDDIQGTASVVVAGVISSLSLCQKHKVSEHTFLFYGAGEAGVGIANMLAYAIQKETGCSLEQAQKQIWLVDSQGLVTSDRSDARAHTLAHHKQPYAHPLPPLATPQPPPQAQSVSTTESGDVDSIKSDTSSSSSSDSSSDSSSSSEEVPSTLLACVERIKPTALIGVSAQGGAFDQFVCEKMASLNEKPLIFALSNPTSKAECTATQAYEWTNGNCVFASGSPFDPVTLSDGRQFTPGQGNNAYIFPGVGLGALAAKAMTITDDDLYVAAATLASLVTKDRLDMGCAYPPLSEIRAVSAKIAAAVALNIHKDGRNNGGASVKPPADMEAYCKSLMYVPKY